MSKENVEAVQRAYEAFQRGDVEEAFASLDPDIVFKPTHEAPVHGRDAVRASLERWRAPWEGHEMILEETIDAGDHVIQPILFRGRGRGSGIEIESRFFQVFTVQDGRAVRWEEFTERSEAFEAAGLSERDAHGNS
jgi:ketosteroid isomerase-like protein